MSLDENSKEAKCCNSEYNKCRQSVLRMYKWGFANKRVVLSPDPVAPAFEYDYAFQLPADCIKILELFEYEGEFKREGNQLLCNTDSLNLKYTFDAVDLTGVDPLFCDLLEWYLAWNISRYLTESETVRQETWNGFRAILPMSKFHQSTEHSQELFEDETLIEARFGSGFVRDPRTS